MPRERCRGANRRRTFSGIISGFFAPLRDIWRCFVPINGGFSSSKSAASKPPSTPDFGAFVRGQIEAQRDQPYPVSFTAPDGTKCRVWLANDSRGNQIIGDDRWWRVNVTDLLKQEEERRPITPWRPTAETLRRPMIVVRPCRMLL
jgi:hypothetical protein